MAFWGAVAGIGASLLGDVLGGEAQKDAADSAADASLQAAREAIGFQEDTRDIIRSDTAPYREAGYTALDALMGLTGLRPPTSVTNAAIRGTPTNQVDLRREEEARIAEERQVLSDAGVPDEPVGGIGGLRSKLDMTGGSLWSGADQSYQDRVAEHEALQEQVIQDELGRTPTTPGSYLDEYQALQRLNDRQAHPVGEATVLNRAINPDDPTSTASYAGFRADPGYEFRLNEGARALERSAAARGGLLSGGTGRAISRYAQDYASNEYTNVYNRIANIAGMGQVAQQGNTQAALQYGANAGNAIMNAGQTRASAYAAKGNTRADIYGSLGDAIPEIYEAWRNR